MVNSDESRSQIIWISIFCFKQKAILAVSRARDKFFLYIFPGPCSLGQQMNPNTLTCVPCPVGYYQESNKQFVCVECPAGRKFTVGTGSTSFSDCKGRVGLTFWTQHVLSCDMTKPTKWVCSQWRLRSAWASTQSDQSLCCVLSG